MCTTLEKVKIMCFKNKELFLYKLHNRPLPNLGDELVECIFVATNHLLLPV
jgi:hypothetical protein